MSLLLNVFLITTHLYCLRVLHKILKLCVVIEMRLLYLAHFCKIIIYVVYPLYKEHLEEFELILDDNKNSEPPIILTKNEAISKSY